MAEENCFDVTKLIIQIMCVTDDLEISLNGKDILFKYADDTSIVSPVWKEQDNSVDIVRTFMEWSEKNCMSSNSKKCKELVIRKKSCTNVFTPVFGIPQTCQLSVLGLILQDNCRFDCTAPPASNNVCGREKLF